MIEESRPWLLLMKLWQKFRSSVNNACVTKFVANILVPKGCNFPCSQISATPHIVLMPQCIPCLKRQWRFWPHFLKTFQHKNCWCSCHTAWYVATIGRMWIVVWRQEECGGTLHYLSVRQSRGLRGTGAVLGPIPVFTKMAGGQHEKMPREVCYGAGYFEV